MPLNTNLFVLYPHYIYTFLLLVTLKHAHSASLNRPNIVFILADDLGFNDVGHHGGEIPTPNIDALGYHGVIFNRHYSQPTCSPSRAALLTGKYPMRFGMQGKPIAAGTAVGLPLNEVILPEYLGELGYKSHLVGKWHLGSFRSEYLPTNRGFDTHFGYWNGYIGHYDGIHSAGGGFLGMDMHRGEEDAWVESYGKHITHLLTREAVQKIKDHPGDKGLFLYLAHSAPHTGNVGMELQSPPIKLDQPRRNNITNEKRRIYADMVKALDDSVGEIVEALAEEKKLNNTIIVFISDNGSPSTDELWGYHNYGSNWPLRGEKCSSHEGGIRTAGVIWSPSFEKPGRVYNNMIHITDWLPTLLSATGKKVSVSGLDGVDHWKRLETGEGTPPRRTLLADIEDWGAEAIIQGKWKLIRSNYPEHELAFSDKYYGESGRGVVEYNVSEVKLSPAGRLTRNGLSPKDYLQLRKDSLLDSFCSERIDKGNQPLAISCHKEHCLFDITADPCESRNLADKYPHIVKELKAILYDYRIYMIPKPIITLDPLAEPQRWGYRWTPWLDEKNTGYTTLPNLSGLILTAYLLFRNHLLL